MSWIVIPRWEEFQHYKNRDPVWIRVYTRLLSDDAYLSLTPHRALVLHRLWLEYARSGRTLPLDTRKLSRRLSLRVTSRDIEALNDAGFVEVSASTPLPLNRTEEKVHLAVTAVASYARGAARKSRTKPRELPSDLAAKVAELSGADSRTASVVASFMHRGLPEAAFRNALEATREAGQSKRLHGTEIGYFVGTLRKIEKGGQYS